MSPVRIGIAGACGRMGRELLEEVYDLDKSLGLPAAALEYAGHPLLGINAALLAGEIITPNESTTEELIRVSDTFDPKSVDVFIDFSTPAGAVALSKKCRKHKIPMVIGVTNFSETEKKELEAAAADIPLLISPNMSAGMLSMFGIVRKAASTFKNGDVEICESHHRHKKDAPSGTALRLGEIVAEGLGVDFNKAKVLDRQQRQGKERNNNEIGFSSIRAGDIIGEHRVIFASDGEQIEIIHRSTSRRTYATGAVLAAGNIIGKPPGLYSMEGIFEELKKGS